MGYGLYVLAPARLGLVVTAVARRNYVLQQDTCH